MIIMHHIVYSKNTYLDTFSKKMNFIPKNAILFHNMNNVQLIAYTYCNECGAYNQRHANWCLRNQTPQYDISDIGVALFGVSMIIIVYSFYVFGIILRILADKFMRMRLVVMSFLIDSFENETMLYAAYGLIGCLFVLWGINKYRAAAT